MPDTFEALLIAILIVVPGATFVWGMEKVTGAWGAKAGDRVLRFVAISVIVHAFLSPLTYELYRDYVHTNYLRDAKPLPTSIWYGLIAYALLPFVLGSWVGRALNERRPIITAIFGRQADAPRAWDYVFSGEPGGYVRLLLKTNPPIWVAGAFATTEQGQRSYAATYPEDGDLYLASRIHCHPDTGEILTDGRGRPTLLDGGLLVRWGEIQYLEFIER